MRRELIESYYEEYQRELERFLESDPEMFTLEAEIHHYIEILEPVLRDGGQEMWQTLDYFSEKYNGGNCGKRNVYPGISGL
mgnify:CR=1 FL=1